jgi:CRP-like cAMP-binding protein
MSIINAFGFDDKYPDLLSFTPSRKDISSIAGITYETVIRMLGELEKSKIILQEGKAIRVLDFEYLKTLWSTKYV